MAKWIGVDAGSQQAEQNYAERRAKELHGRMSRMKELRIRPQEIEVESDFRGPTVIKADGEVIGFVSLGPEAVRVIVETFPGQEYTLLLSEHGRKLLEAANQGRRIEELQRSNQAILAEKRDLAQQLEAMTADRDDWIRTHKVAIQIMGKELARMAGLALGKADAR